jgi:acetylornithine/N-succinyldiaminopimelate aminotransferase
MRDGFEPLLPGFAYAPFNDLEAALALVDENTAGFLVETVQGEGGMTAGTLEFIQGLRKACDEHGMLLILDEIQCGYGRTGKFFAYEHYGIVPDIMTVAKGIGGGFPLGACLATEEAAKGMVIGTHGSTYGGNPLAMAAGQAILDIMLEPGFFDHVAAMGERLRGAFEQLLPNHDDLFEEIRGKGLMLGIKMKETGGEPRFRRPSARQSWLVDGRCGRKCVPRIAAFGDRGKPHRRVRREASLPARRAIHSCCR